MLKFLLKKSCLISIAISLYLIFSMFFNILENSFTIKTSLYSFNVLKGLNAILWSILVFIMLVSVFSFSIRIEKVIKNKKEIKKYFNRANTWNLVNSLTSLSSLILIKLINIMFANDISGSFSLSSEQQTIIASLSAFLMIVLIVVITYLSFIYASSDLNEDDNINFNLWINYYAKNIKTKTVKEEGDERKNIFQKFLKKIHLILTIIDQKAEIKFKIRSKKIILSILKSSKPNSLKVL